MAPPTSPRTPDPPWAARFVLEVDSVRLGSFTEVSGLAVTIETEQVVEGGQNQYTHTLLGRMTWPNLVFKRGITDTDSLFAWLSTFSGEKLADEGNRIRGSGGKISLFDAAGTPVREWSFLDAKPVRWTGPSFASSGSDLAMEELEVAHCGFETG